MRELSVELEDCVTSESTLHAPETIDVPAPDIPTELAILPLFNMVVYPQTVIPLAVGQELSIRLIDSTLR